MNFPRRVWQHLVNPDSRHGQIAKGVLWVSLFVMVGKLAGAAKEMAIAWHYGVGPEVDAYLFVYNIVSWPVAVWSGALTIVLVPLAARMRAGSPHELPRFRAELLGLTLLGGALLLALAWVGLPMLLASSWTGLLPVTLELALQSLPVMVWLLPLGGLITVHAAWMLAGAHHSNSLLESIPALTILVVLLSVQSAGLVPLVWGTVAGAALHLLILSLLARRQGAFVWPHFAGASAQWSHFMQGLTLAIAGQAVMGLISLVDQFYATHLGQGALATLSYANRVLGLILSLGATAVSRATMPVFSAAYQQNERGARAVVRHWTLLMFVTGCIIVGAAALAAPWVIQLLFERGQFTAKDSQAVTEVFRCGLLQLPFFAAGLIHVSWLTSQRRYMAIFLISVCNLLVKLLANSLLAPWLGLNGLMVSTALMLATSLLLLVFVGRTGGAGGR